MGRLFSSSSLMFKQHLLSLTQGTNNREAEKQTITGFVKEPKFKHALNANNGFIL